MKFNRKILWIGRALLLLGFSIFMAFIWSQNVASQTSSANSKVKIVGIWKNQHTILEYRPDGTARSWDIDGKTIRSAYSHLRYRSLGDELFLYYSGKPDEFLQRLGGALFGETEDHYQATKLSNSELQLLDRGTGVTVMFERFDDTVLNASPQNSELRNKKLQPTARSILVTCVKSYSRTS